MVIQQPLKNADHSKLKVEFFLKQKLSEINSLSAMGEILSAQRDMKIRNQLRPKQNNFRKS